MHSLLEEINQLYLPYEDTDITYVTVEYFHSLTDAEWETFKRKKLEGDPVRSTAQDRFVEAAPKLAPSDLIEGYKQGCRTLKGNIGGYMYLHFDEAYIPTMIQGIEADDDVAYLFLGALKERLDTEAFIPVVLTALTKDNRRTLDTALVMVEKLNIPKAAPLVSTLRDNPHPQVAAIARRVFKAIQ